MLKYVVRSSDWNRLDNLELILNLNNWNHCFWCPEQKLPHHVVVDLGAVVVLLPRQPAPIPGYLCAPAHSLIKIVSSKR